MSIIVRDRIINKDIIDILYDIQRSCHNGKLAQISDGSTDIKVTCPHHSEGKERKAACFVNKDDGKFHCFVCNFKGVDFSKFVNECFNKTGDWGEDWLIANYASDYINQGLMLDKIDLNSKVEQNNLDESILDKFESYHPYMTTRHLTKDVIDKYKIKYDKEYKSLVFPVWDINGDLKFLTRRSVEGKSFLIDKNADKSCIYLLNFVKYEPTVFVVEAQLSALVMNGWGYPTIALFGAGTNEEQINVLNRTGIRRFILCYDNDQAGWKGENRFKKYISNDKFVDSIRLPLYKDPNDMTKEEFTNLVSLQIPDYFV